MDPKFLYSNSCQHIIRTIVTDLISTETLMTFKISHDLNVMTFFISYNEVL